jgi:WD40 repeat protein
MDGPGVISVVFLPNSKQLLSLSLGGGSLGAGNAGGVVLWDVEAGRPIRELKESNKTSSVCWSGNGKSVLGFMKGRMALWNMETGKVVWKSVLKPNEGNSWAISSNGRWVLSGGEGGPIRLRDGATGKVLHTFEGKGAPLSFSPNGIYALCRTGDAKVGLWEIASGKRIKTLPVSDNAGLTFSGDGKLIFAVGETITVWEAASGKLARCQKVPIKEKKDALYRLRIAFSPDFKWALSGELDTNLILWDMGNGKAKRTFGPAKGIPRPLETIAFSSDGKLAATGGQGESLRVWDVATGKCIRKLVSGRKD